MNASKSSTVVPGSFRDPSGFLFYRHGALFRQINHVYKENYDLLLNSGLYEKLVKEELLISHVEVDEAPAQADCAYKVIKPEPISFISYPYEWCFSQLKDAALTTLRIQQYALDFGMSLKDSSAYNIQFRNGKPVLIDTLSFERYPEGRPWIAYQQFCQHFLAPLTLMRYKDINLGQLLRVYIDGIPLDLTSSLLPPRTYLRFSLFSHIHLHAKTQRHFADKTIDMSKRTMSRFSLRGLIDNLIAAVGTLKWQPDGTTWGDYYKDTNYSPEAFNHKKELVEAFLNETRPNSVWDCGANVGVFSRIASGKKIETVSFDNDPTAVEKNYLESRTKDETHMLPLLLDVTNPSGGVGWANEERMSLRERGPVDTAMALALVHHLAISNNVPLEKIAKYFSTLCASLIVEFVPKHDSQVQRLLATREDIFPYYTREHFEAAFTDYFSIRRVSRINGTERTLYLMNRI